MLENGRVFLLSQLCHKNIYFSGTDSLAKYFKIQQNNEHVTGRRNQMHMEVPRQRTVMGRGTFSTRGPISFWNSLPNVIRVIDKIELFSKGLIGEINTTLDNRPRLVDPK